MICVKCGASFEGEPHPTRKPFCSQRCRWGRPRHGELHHFAKLTEAQVRAIRADPRMGIVIAADYGITPGHASLIRSRKTWRHL